MAETIDEIIAKLPSGDELITRAIGALRKAKPRNANRMNCPRPLWSRVADLTLNGSGYGRAICIKYGFDPDETWKP